VTVSERCRPRGSLVCDLDLPGRSGLVMLVKKSGPVVPTPDMTIDEGDVVLIYAARQDVPRLERMFNTRIPQGP